MIERLYYHHQILRSNLLVDEASERLSHALRV
jgi:hypothetical protein